MKMNLATAARNAYRAAKSNADLAFFAEDVFRGQKAKLRMEATGKVVTGEIFAITNQGFNGLVVSAYVGRGKNRVVRCAPMTSVIVEI